MAAHLSGLSGPAAQPEAMLESNCFEALLG